MCGGGVSWWRWCGLPDGRAVIIAVDGTITECGPVVATSQQYKLCLEVLAGSVGLVACGVGWLRALCSCAVYSRMLWSGEGRGRRTGGRESEGSFKDRGRRISRERNGTQTWEQKFGYLEDGLRVWVDGAATRCAGGTSRQGQRWAAAAGPAVPLQCGWAGRRCSAGAPYEYSRYGEACSEGAVGESARLRGRGTRAAAAAALLLTEAGTYRPAPQRLPRRESRRGKSAGGGQIHGLASPSLATSRLSLSRASAAQHRRATIDRTVPGPGLDPVFGCPS